MAIQPRGPISSATDYYLFFYLDGEKKKNVYMGSIYSEPVVNKAEIDGTKVTVTYVAMNLYGEDEAFTETYDYGVEIESVEAEKNYDGDVLYIYATSKTEKITIDLTTLSGYADLSEVDYQITVVAKNEEEGYLESDPSEEVTFTKPASLSDLTDTTWLFDDSGRPSTLYNYIQRGYADVDFTCPDTVESFIQIVADVGWEEVFLAYKDESGTFFYAFDEDSQVWASEYRTITITGGDDATNAGLIAWLQDNATQIG